MSAQTLEGEAFFIVGHLREAKSGLERVLRALEDTGAPILIVDENADNLTKISDVLSTYEAEF